MQLSDEDIQEFITIYRKEFQEELSLDDARRMATEFLTLYLALARPLPSEKPNRQRSEKFLDDPL